LQNYNFLAKLYNLKIIFNFTSLNYELKKVYNMESKKTPRADLENKKLLFREIGLIVALGCILVAFEWKSTTSTISTLKAAPKIEAEEEIAPITREQPQNVPPPPKAPVLSDFIDIVDDNVKVNDKLLTIEDDKNLGVEVKNYVPQQETEEVVEDEVIPFAIIEEKPKFQGGDQNTFTKWVYANLEYPEIAKENGIQGRVVVKFVVDKTGKVTDVSVIRGVDPSLDNEAMKVIKSSPRWTPGRQRHKPTKVSFTFPIIFQLR
jgi:protein TonB